MLKLTVKLWNSHTDILYMVHDMVHSKILGGHLGTDKTQKRILQRFYCPGDVQNYCHVPHGRLAPQCLTFAAPYFQSLL